MMYPRFCPNPQCLFHHTPPPNRSWFTHSGSYPTRAFGRVKRFRCNRCGRKFSTQSFSIDYFAKRTLNYRSLFNQLISTSSVRDMARWFGVRTHTIENKLDRLTRSALALHTRLLRELTLSEPLVADGFESFTVSQYFPNNITLLLGKHSQYLYGLEHVTIRRKGRMREEQKQRRQELEKRFRADPAGIEHSFYNLLLGAGELIREAADPPVALYTDEKKEYQRAIRSLAVLLPLSHQRVSSRRARTVRNPLFSANYMDRQIRKDQANHVRETTCFARNENNMLGRLVVYFTYHNYMKPYRERERCRSTHAEEAGVDAGVMRKEMRHFFTQRAFFLRSDVKGFSRKLWLKGFETPLKMKMDYLPRYAYA